LVRALEVLFLLHAEHELNCSTSAARHLASSGEIYFNGASFVRASEFSSSIAGMCMSLKSCIYLQLVMGY
jgi:hypothetical protein